MTETDSHFARSGAGLGSGACAAVRMHHGVLASVSAEDVLNGANASSYR
ncbi:MAG: hypothetical protein R3D84_13565 [Paracoccaceae bacterium]